MASTKLSNNRSFISKKHLINPPVVPKTDKHAKENYNTIKSLQKRNKDAAQAKEEAAKAIKPPFKLEQFKHVESLVFSKKPKTMGVPYENPPALEAAKTAYPNFGSKPEYLETHRQNRAQEKKEKDWNAVTTKYQGMRCLPEEER